MFEIPRYKVLKSLNRVRDVCQATEGYDPKDDECLINIAKNNLLDYTEDEERLKEKFTKETFDFTDNKEYEQEKLEEAYEAVHDCCQECGVYHTEKCFINNTREALQLILYGEIKPWDGIEFKEKQEN